MALCAEPGPGGVRAPRPWCVTSTRSVPWQPPSTIAVGRLQQDREVGLRASRAGGAPSRAEAVALGLDLLAVVEDEGDVAAAARAPSRRGAARPRRPPFMSHGAAAVAGRSPVAPGGQVVGVSGTVSRCPASTTRSARPEVGAGDDRVAVPASPRGGRRPRSAASTASASACSSPLTDSHVAQGRGERRRGVHGPDRVAWPRRATSRRSGRGRRPPASARLTARLPTHRPRTGRGLGLRPGHAVTADGHGPRHLVPDARRLGRARDDPRRRPGRRWPRCRGRDAAPRGAPARGPHVVIDLDAAPADAADAYLRLHLLSPPAGRARTTSTSTASSACSPTSCGPTPARARSRASRRTRLRLREARGRVDGVRGRQVPPDDRLRACPTGVRIADADRVRLGAHLAERHHGDARGLRATSTPARSAPRWSRAGSARAWWSATAPTSAAAPRSWARSPAAARQVISHRRALPARRQRRHRHLARRRLRRRGRAATSPPAPRSRCAGRPRWSRPASCPGASGLLFRRNSVTGAVEARSREPARGSSSTPRCTPTTEPLLPDAALPAAGDRRRARGSSPARRAARRRGGRRVPGLSNGRWSPTVGPTDTARRPRWAGRAELDPRAGRQRRDDRRRRGAARACRPGRPRSRMATAIQESKLRNIDVRRPGLARAVPAAAVARAGAPRSRSSTRSTPANAFYDALVKVDGYQTMRDHRGRPGGAAIGLPRGLRRPRAARAGSWPRP